MWTSEDGLAWSFLDDVVTQIETFVYTGTTFVGVGNTEDGIATSWIWTPNG